MLLRCFFEVVSVLVLLKCCFSPDSLSFRCCTSVVSGSVSEVWVNNNSTYFSPVLSPHELILTGLLEFAILENDENEARQ